MIYIKKTVECLHCIYMIRCLWRITGMLYLSCYLRTRILWQDGRTYGWGEWYAGFSIWINRDVNTKKMRKTKRLIFILNRSRLGCQIQMCKELDGLTVTIPSATRNMRVDGTSYISIGLHTRDWSLYHRI